MRFTRRTKPKTKTQTQTQTKPVVNQQSLDLLFCFSAESGQLATMRSIRNQITSIDYQLSMTKITPLMIAVSKRQLAVVNYLLEQKADISLRDSQNMTAFGHAVYEGYMNVVNVFLKNKNLTADFLATPLGPDHFTVLNIAVDKGHYDIVQQLLDMKMDPNHAVGDNEPPLHRAIQLDRVAIAKLLINHPRTQLNAFAGTPKRTPIMLAILCNRQNIVTLLLNKSQVDRTVKDSQGVGLSEIATLTNDDMFKLLVNYGLDLNMRNHYNETPFHFLVHWKKLALIQWVLATKSQAITLENVQWGIFIAILRKNKPIVLAILNEFLCVLQHCDLYPLAEFAIRQGWFDIALKLIPEMRSLLNSPVLRNHDSVNPSYILSLVEYCKNPTLEFKLFASRLHIFAQDRKTVRQPQTTGNRLISPAELLGIALVKMQPSYFLNITATIPGLAASLDEVKHDRAMLMQFLFPPVFSRTLTSQTIVGSRVCGISPITLFKQQGRTSTEIKELMTFNKDKYSKPNLFVVKHSRKQQPVTKICSWFDGLITSTDSRLLTVEDVTKKNVRLLIPEELRLQPGGESLLNKSRWHFNDKNGLKPIKNALGFKSIKVEMKIGGAKVISLSSTHFTHEITATNSADRILCFRLATAGGSLFVAAYFLENGLHHALPHFPNKIKLTIPLAPPPCLISEQQQAQAFVY